MRMAGLKRTLLFTAALLLALVALFYWGYRPWQLTWGATSDEISREMPGDQIVEKPTFNATRGVTINAPPEHIWAWIVQIGYKKAGFYSWDVLDNDGVASADRIIAEYQQLKLGDAVPLSRNSSATVVDLERAKQLVLVFPPGSPATWAWGLYPIDSTRTRLVTRLRVRADSMRAQFMLDAFEIVMMRKHLLGIKRRAERLDGQTRRHGNEGPLPDKETSKLNRAKGVGLEVFTDSAAVNGFLRSVISALPTRPKQGHHGESRNAT